MSNKFLTVPQAAHQLREGYQVTYRRLLRGEISGEQRASGRWYISAASVSRLVRELQRRQDAA